MSAVNPALYDQWKKSAKHSDEFTMRQTQKEEDQKYEDAKNKFFACTDLDNKIRDEEKRKFIEQNSVFNLKKQF